MELTSSSGDLSDSKFEEMMNAPDSSSSEYEHKTYKKPAGRPNTGDPYAYDINFSNIKIPSKKDPKPKPVPKQEVKKPAPRPKSPIDDDRPAKPSVNQGSKFQDIQKEYKKMIKNLKNDSSEEQLSESSSIGPQLQHWKDVKKDLVSSSESIDEIKTEPFKVGASQPKPKANQPISLNKKLEPGKEYAREVPRQSIKETLIQKPDPKELMSSLGSEYRNSDEISEDELYNRYPTSKNFDEDDDSYEDHEVGRSKAYPESSHDDQTEEDPDDHDYSLTQSNIPNVPEKINQKYSESRDQQYSDSDNYSQSASRKYTEDQSVKSSKYQENYEIRHSARSSSIAENIFQINEVEEPEEPKKNNNPLTQPSKPPLHNIIRPHTASDRLLTRERELEIEIIDLRKAVVEFQSELNIKQEQIYYLEKKEKQANFEKIEFEALEKAKRQLREAYHKIELYKIETEELIKQVDYNEARVKDLEAENNTLKKDIDRKDKINEERIKITESRTSERTIKEIARQFELEKEENLRVRKELETEIARLKTENLHTEGENRELRSKIWSLRDQESRIKDLEVQNYNLSQKLPSSVLEAPPKSSSNEAIQKELESQEQLIKGYQKENEKLMSEIRSLKAQIKDDQLRIYNENKKVDLLKSNLIKEHGGILIKENISDLESINVLAGGNVINKEEYFNLKENQARLTRELLDKEKYFRERELEMNEQIEKLKKFKFEAEIMLNGLKYSEDNENARVLASNFENEKKEIVISYEKEIENLKSRLEFLDNQFDRRVDSFTDSKRIRILEEHCKALEEALKEKEPISTLIKAVKPESSEQVEFLIKRVSELESELKKNNFNGPKPKTPASKQTKSVPKPSADPSLINQIKDLEKKLEDTKKYYIAKINSIKPTESEELKHLREQINNYEKMITKLKSSQSLQIPNMFNFLSSEIGSIWYHICKEISGLHPYISQKSSKELIGILGQIIEILESSAASPSFASYASFDRILDKTLSISSFLKGIPNWGSIEKVYSEVCNIINSDLASYFNQSETKMAEDEEEYWSDFSDCDQEQEDLENSESLKVVQKIKDGIGYLNRIGGGWLNLDQVQDLLCTNIPQLVPLNVQPLLRKIDTQGGKVNIDQFLVDLRNNSIDLWKKKIFNAAWEGKNQISNKGNYHSIVDRSLIPWIINGILDKIENYVLKEGIDYEMLVEQLFSGNLNISKRNLRSKVLEHKLPLTREECHVIVKELDRSKIGQISARVFLNFIKRGPRQAWAPQRAEELPEYKHLSERDASFLLLQANKKIQELESQAGNGVEKRVNLTPDHTLSLKIKTLEEQQEILQSKLSSAASEIEKLKLDKQRLEIYISKQTAPVGTSEYLALQRKLEAIEENQYRREQELKNRMSGISFKTEIEIQELKKKHESEKNILQQIISKKTEEINEFKIELEELLNEIEQLRSKRKK